MRIQTGDKKRSGDVHDLEIVVGDSGDDTSQVEAAGKVKVVLPPSGGGSQPIMSGEGSPIGVVTPTAAGWLYVDLSDFALYQALGDTDADWIGVGGETDYDTAVGVHTESASTRLQDGVGGAVDVGSGSVVLRTIAGQVAQIIGGGQLAMNAADDGDGHAILNFFTGDAGVTQPIVPLTTPSVQDVIDALVGLGLVSQSD